jgi:hypothetical protein
LASIPSRQDDDRQQRRRASLNAVYDPMLDVTNIISAARKLGCTYSDSWDVLYYTE